MVTVVVGDLTDAACAQAFCRQVNNVRAQDRVEASVVGTRRWRRRQPVTAVGLAAAVLAMMFTAPAATNAAATTGPALSVDVSAARHAISPDIYGLNGGDPAFSAEIGQSVARWGGNASTRYNFKNHTYNTGSDWYFENIVADDQHSVEGVVKSDLDRGIKPVVTVPLIGWVAKDSPSSHPFTCGFPATRFPQQDGFDQWDPNCGNGQLNQQKLTGVPTDTSIPQDASFDGEMASHLVSQFGTAAQGGVPIYELDNEPVLWSSTHRDVHPEAVSDDELGNKGTAAAAAIKAADPSAAVLGPSGWGYCEWVASGVDGCGPGADSAAHGGLNLSQWVPQEHEGLQRRPRPALPGLLRPALLPADQRRQGPRVRRVAAALHPVAVGPDLRRRVLDRAQRGQRAAAAVHPHHEVVGRPVQPGHQDRHHRVQLGRAGRHQRRAGRSRRPGHLRT
ncbi:glycosyl hydrolase [Kutzneria sp. 744]|nr:glycosyl hydrolase [Kutzneria sp. 744]